MDGGLGTIEVWIIEGCESTVLIIVFEVLGLGVVPFIGHDLFDILGCDGVVRATAFLPFVEKIVVERAHSLCCLCGHFPDLN